MLNFLFLDCGIKVGTRGVNNGKLVFGWTCEKRYSYVYFLEEKNPSNKKWFGHQLCKHNPKHPEYQVHQTK